MSHTEPTVISKDLLPGSPVRVAVERIATGIKFTLAQIGHRRSVGDPQILVFVIIGHGAVHAAGDVSLPWLYYTCGA
jgi:hypothetical protein